ncbi:MAG TPA: Gfo/Idh/MocA family oxidoreductase [Bryobacteraceae bacterium]|nr:Gfo/Idh/MocA family oxidoreductase [Bryobacteraceae bacterium]
MNKRNLANLLLHQNRREFLKRGAALATAAFALPANGQKKGLTTVRVGIVGVGNRGSGHVRNLLRLPGVELKAACDLVASKVENVQNLAQKAGKPRPESYTDGPQDYKRLCARQDLDLVYVTTPWELHTPIAVEAMKSGKHAAIEVPAATTVEECWQLVETAEATGRYCVQLENCNYDRVELMALNMVRKGLLGEIVHAECGYLHDLREGKLVSRAGKELWRLNHTLRRNADLYPTHGLGPVAQCLNINRGNQFDHMVSMASKSYALKAFAAERFGAESPQSKLDIALGDVVTSTIRTRAGQTIILVHDTNTPRPYSRKFLVQGSKGLVEKYPTPRVYLDHKSPAHEWEDLEKYAKEWEHPLWAKLSERSKGGGHGGMDFVMTWRLVDCLLKGEAPDMDVYDAAALSAVTELSERSIANRSRTMDFPDFTRGKWLSRAPLGIVA